MYICFIFDKQNLSICVRCWSYGQSILAQNDNIEYLKYTLFHCDEDAQYLDHIREKQDSRLDKNSVLLQRGDERTRSLRSFRKLLRPSMSWIIFLQFSI